MPFRNDGEGLHRSVDPADGKHYVYGMSFMDAAPTIFACFDQPDLKAPYTFHVRAPQDWVVIGNAPGQQVEKGVWEFEQSQPLSTYFVTIVAGPYHVIRDEHDGIPLGLSARASIAADLDKDADELFTLTRQSFDELHRLFGIRYPFGDYHQAFVPEFNAGAMENPGCVTFRDPLVFTSRVTRGLRIARASTLAHEMAHQWFGNLVTPAWWDDLWLNESFAEYLGNRVTADVTEYADDVGRQLLRAAPVGAGGRPAAEHPPGRRQRRGRRVARRSRTSTASPTPRARPSCGRSTRRWATTCSSAAPSTTSSGTASATPRCTTCSRAGSAPAPADMSTFTDNWLRTAGPDRIELDRAAGVIRRTPPADHPADRPHRIRAAVAAPDGTWTDQVLDIDGPETAFDAGDRPVLLDPYLDSWALTVPDELTIKALATLLPQVKDPELRAGTWSNIRSALHNAAVDPVDVLEVAVRSLPIEDTEDTPRRTMAWVYTWVVPLQPDPGRRAGPAPRGRSRQARRRPRRRPRSRSRRSVRRPAPRPTRISCAPGSTATSPRACPSTSTCAGGPWSSWRRWVRSTGPSWTGGSRTSPRPSPGCATPPRAPRCPTPEAKAWAWSCFTGETSLPNYELEAVGRGFWRGGQARAPRRRTSTATSTTSPRPSRSAAAGCWPRRSRTSSRARR